MTTLAHRTVLSVLPNRRVGIALFLLTASSIRGHAVDSESWQRAPSEGQIRSLLNLPATPKADIYEVVPTKVETALVWHLAKVPFAFLRALMLTSLPAVITTAMAARSRLLCGLCTQMAAPVTSRFATTVGLCTFTMARWEIVGRQRTYP